MNIIKNEFQNYYLGVLITQNKKTGNNDIKMTNYSYDPFVIAYQVENILLNKEREEKINSFLFEFEVKKNENIKNLKSAILLNKETNQISNYVYKEEDYNNFINLNKKEKVTLNDFFGNNEMILLESKINNIDLLIKDDFDLLKIIKEFSKQEVAKNIVNSRVLSSFVEHLTIEATDNKTAKTLLLEIIDTPVIREIINVFELIENKDNIEIVINPKYAEPVKFSKDLDNMYAMISFIYFNYVIMKKQGLNYNENNFSVFISYNSPISIVGDDKDRFVTLFVFDSKKIIKLNKEQVKEYLHDMNTYDKEERELIKREICVDFDKMKSLLKIK